ncbi:hypothetical protein HL658_24670 [Azospirillum sp. RWY-5-1]|uniref:Uncharacterized protein n=1 Tax=Azospirillum oleiclasticum TaxID=2735135 RepID=A0ABX2TCN4_9PROT|nr:hypothetical protein [Azospirillum oleiclasticum]NYZ15748.1 hypothetical protein [Azospirillum oleiclasticum]NYZ22018.1 hypothetical protein [Azospirillum oleiclasticum]
MSVIAKMQNINAASLAHISLLDDFIKLTQEKVVGHADPFVRESLGELLDSLRHERQGYVTLLGSSPMGKAA